MQFDNNSKYSITIDYLDITFQASIFLFFFFFFFFEMMKTDLKKLYNMFFWNI